MKRVSALILAVIMCAMIVCAFAFTAFAESTAYEISELNMSIPVPDDMLVLTRKSTKNDQFFKTFKLDYENTMSQLKDGNIYLEAVTKDSALTLTVTMTKTQDSTKIGNYNSLSDEELSNIMKKLRENKAYKDASPVEYKDIKYICLNMKYKSGKKTVYAQQYNTVVNGENINITMLAAPGKKLTAANKETLAGIVSETTILNDTFFNRNKNLILYGSITIVAIAIVVVVFIILLKYFRNPNRKHKILVHELAHEHKISETTAIPRKHIFNVTQPTNSFLTKYQPVDELGKRGKKKKATVADEVKNTKSVSEPAPEEAAEQPITSMEYDSKPDDIVCVVDDDEIIEEVKAQAAKIQDEEAAAEAVEATEEEVAEAPAEAVEAEVEAQAEEAEVETVADESEQTTESAEVEETEPEVQDAEQSEENFDESADYFDNVPDEEEMYSYTDVDTAVEDYTAAKRQKYYDDEEEIIESVQENTIWETVKKVLLAIGRGILTVFKAIGIGIVYLVTHLRYFFINLFRMIKRNRAMKKRQKAEQERRRQASERRRMEREAERARQRANAGRGANDLVKVHSSGERRRPPQSAQRQRTARPSSSRNSSRDRSSRPRR